MKTVNKFYFLHPSICLCGKVIKCLISTDASKHDNNHHTNLYLMWIYVLYYSRKCLSARSLPIGHFQLARSIFFSIESQE